MIKRPEPGHDLREDIPSSQEATPRSVATLIILALCAMLTFTGFVALGSWQIQRLHWKRALIERVEQRVHAPPIPAPEPIRWPQVSAESDEYRHVRLTGVFIHDLTTKVQAATELGSGYWLLTPLRRQDGSIVFVNRGFILPGEEDSSANSAEQTTVTGLLRISEPGGALLRHNDPAANRWYSRDVQAIATARGLSHVAPYFVDADALHRDGIPKYPVGGLTVIAFHNNHLGYALTWYALALMVAAAAFWIAREERKARSRDHANTDHIE